ncbi:hypothetical protein Nstercoris_00141 [Nitrosomonas stercoris]|uniref:Lipoprotein n=1 Tax=Nitrosomonas stercoris TaxID=1444684 RepID=A0A4Y1YPR6_9PROT|nr:hypothetical protein Nstercoris_00141 [Nitrosomonas stercoris]
MKHVLVVAMLLMATTMLSGCLIDTDKPGNYPPSMMLERDSMPDDADLRPEKWKQQQAERSYTNK